MSLSHEDLYQEWSGQNKRLTTGNSYANSIKYQYFYFTILQFQECSLHVSTFLTPFLGLPSIVLPTVSRNGCTIPAWTTKGGKGPFSSLVPCHSCNPSPLSNSFHHVNTRTPCSSHYSAINGIYFRVLNTTASLLAVTY